MKRLTLLLLLSVLAAFAQHSPAIKNFGAVDVGEIYRGAQPTGADLLDLAGLGFKSVIDLRDDATVDREQVQVEGLGMKFVNVPLKGLSAPSDKNIATLMILLERMPKPIFIHCQHGEDRTGTVIACWRMWHEHMPNVIALDEAKFYHINPLQFGMKHYIKKFRPVLMMDYK